MNLLFIIRLKHLLGYALIDSVMVTVLFSFLCADSVCHAKVMGRSLSPEFMVDISDPADYSILKYLPGASKLRLEDIMISDPKDSAEWNSLVARYRQMTHRVTADLLLGPVHFMDDEEDDVGAVTDDDIYM
jgi:hypothetical protein